MNTFEGALKLLEDNPNYVEFQRRFPDIVEGLTDLKERFEAMELASITAKTQIAELETKYVNLASMAQSFAKDRDSLAARVAKVETAPAQHKEAIAALETRVRTAEGALAGLGKPATSKPPSLTPTPASP